MSSYLVTFVASFLVILASYPLRLCAGEDRLTVGRFISGNQTITSDVGRFTLGFFSPGNSSTNLYLGIWYNKIPEQTVVWIANRDAPLPKNSDGVFALRNDNNLVILDGRRIVWKANVSYVGATGSNSTAILDNSGNLILRDGKGRVLWQSFDYPTDTLLPGMKFCFNLNTHESNYLTSWAGKDDPRTGVYKFGFDPRGPMQFFIWHKSGPYWRSQVWDGSGVTTSAYISNKYFLYVTDTMNDEIFYISFGVSDNSMLSRFALNTTGILELQLWQENNMKWLVVFSAPGDQCDIYGRCGPFGICDVKNSPWICKCLTGFEPKVQKDWDMGDWSGGCVRKAELKCNEEDIFVMFQGMKLPDNSIALKNFTMKQCKIECRRNCSCTAYAYANASVWITARCIYWVGNLMDVKGEYIGGHDLYIRLDGSEQVGNGQGQKNDKHTIVIATAAAAVGVLLIVALSYALLRRSFKKKRRGETSVMNINFKASKTSGNQNGSELTSFSLSSILAAADGFSSKNKLGEGGFGPVYRGSLPEGQEIAVKRLSKSSGQGLEEFMNEVTLIAKLQHRNLVRLLGFCVEKEEKMLIYEYLPNKSLDKFLFDSCKQVNLDWSTRCHIIEGIAQGLLYLHKYSRLRIIHRDLKASNILLDDAMNPKISDFGTARIFGGNQTEANTSRVVGTYGYMSPEYALNGLFSEKSDVFSFGVLLIEIVSGKKNTGFYPTDHAPNLLAYAWELWREERALELMDQSIRDSCIDQEVLKCVQIGLLCVQEDAGARPTMSAVVSMLGNNSATLPVPEEPAFFTGRSSINVYSGFASKNCSINELTISSIEPQ